VQLTIKFLRPTLSIIIIEKPALTTPPQYAQFDYSVFLTNNGTTAYNMKWLTYILNVEPVNHFPEWLVRRRVAKSCRNGRAVWACFPPWVAVMPKQRLTVRLDSAFGQCVALKTYIFDAFVSVGSFYESSLSLA